MKLDKRGVAGGKIFNYAVVALLGIVGVVVLIELVADVFPNLVTAGTALNASGMPLGELFTAGGAIWYIVPIVIILAVVALLMGSKSK